MNPIQSFDPALNPSGTIITNGINKGEQILLFNSSLSCLQLEFPDKTKDVLPPSWSRDWIKSSPMGVIKYTTLFTLPLSGQPVSLLYGTLYEPGEHVSSVNQALQYVYAIGNTVNTTGSGATLINKLNAASGLSIIELANTSPGGDTFSVDNQGNVVIGNATQLGSLFAYGIVTLDNSTQFQSGAGNETHMINISGSDIVFQSPAGTEIARIANNGQFKVSLIEPVGSNLILSADNAHAVLIQNNGTTLVGFQGNGLFVYEQIKFPNASSNASLTAMCFIPTITLATTIGTFNHNLGVTPDLILLMPSGTSSTARTYQTTNYTSTTFQATGNSAFGCIGVAIKF